MIKEPQICVSCTTQSLTASQWWLLGDHWEAEHVGLDTAIVGPQCCWTTWMYFPSLWPSRCLVNYSPLILQSSSYFSFSPSFKKIHLLLWTQMNQKRKKKMPASIHYSAMSAFTCTWAVCSPCIFFQHSHIVSYWIAGPSHFPLFEDITLTHIFPTPLALPRSRITVVIMLIYNLQSCWPHSLYFAFSINK